MSYEFTAAVFRVVATTDPSSPYSSDVGFSPARGVMRSADRTPGSH